MEYLGDEWTTKDFIEHERGMADARAIFLKYADVEGHRAWTINIVQSEMGLAHEASDWLRYNRLAGMLAVVEACPSDEEVA